MIAFAPANNKSYKYPYQDPSLPVNKRVSELLSRMTTIEKIKQLDMYHGYEVADMAGHDANAYSARKTAEALNSTGARSIQDLYPQDPAIIIQKGMLNSKILAVKQEQ